MDTFAQKCANHLAGGVICTATRATTGIDNYFVPVAKTV